MKNFKITIDVTNVYYADVEAETEAEAIKMAETEAYQDTWSGSAVYGGAEVYDVEELNETQTEKK